MAFALCFIVTSMYVLFEVYGNEATQVFQKHLGSILHNQTDETPPFIKAITDPTDKTYIRLSCPEIGARYNPLKAPNVTQSSSFLKTATTMPIKYFFAMDLYNSWHVMPSLFTAIYQAIEFLGPDRCAVSIVEGRSTDGTYDAIIEFGVLMDSIGTKFYLGRNDSDPRDGVHDRILSLAGLRNQALRPLSEDRHLFSPDANVIFLNDVVICVDDILEMIHQHIAQNAHMACAMDWNDKDGGILFYDVWVARAINGDTFFEVPQSAEWRYAENLFWNEPDSKAKLDRREPFQVYACWNGGAVFTAKPIMNGEIEFRIAVENECYMGEPTLFCKDLWRRGYGRIQTLPTVNVAYSISDAKKTKSVRGRVGDTVDQLSEVANDVMIDWQGPPPMVKCAHDWW